MGAASKRVPAGNGGPPDADTIKEALERLTQDGPTMKIVLEVIAERLAQDRKFGNVHDSEHSARDWVAFVTAYAGKAVGALDGDDTPGHSYRDRMIQVAALALCAVQQADRGHI